MEVLDDDEEGELTRLGHALTLARWLAGCGRTCRQALELGLGSSALSSCESELLLSDLRSTF